MRLAFPVWENRISPVLDTATRLLVVEVKDHCELSRSEIFLDERDVSRKCRRIRSLGVNALICGAVTRRLSNMLNDSGIHIIPGVSGRPDEVLDACLQGRLAHSKFLMPGWNVDGLEEGLKGLNLKAREKKEPGRPARKRNRDA
jgi:predicted Fe-Mo cluster-binding NifX family protein